MLTGLFQQLRRELDRNDDNAVIIGDDDISRHDQHVSASERHINGKRDDVGLGVEVRGHATQPQTKPKFLDLRVVADAAIYDYSNAATAFEVCQHHLAKNTAAHITSCVDNYDVARLGMV